jgi:hypothetical protein
MHTLEQNVPIATTLSLKTKELLVREWNIMFQPPPVRCYNRPSADHVAATF